MLEQPRVRRLIFILIAGEIVVAIGAVLSDMSTEEFVHTVTFFAGVWIIYSFISIWIDRLTSSKT
jgi:hypothetical protein